MVVSKLHVQESGHVNANNLGFRTQTCHHVGVTMPFAKNVTERNPTTALVVAMTDQDELVQSCRLFSCTVAASEAALGRNLVSQDMLITGGVQPSEDMLTKLGNVLLTRTTKPT